MFKKYGHYVLLLPVVMFIVFAGGFWYLETGGISFDTNNNDIENPAQTMSKEISALRDTILNNANGTERQEVIKRAYEDYLKSHDRQYKTDGDYVDKTKEERLSFSEEYYTRFEKELIPLIKDKEKFQNVIGYEKEYAKSRITIETNQNKLTEEFSGPIPPSSAPRLIELKKEITDMKVELENFPSVPEEYKKVNKDMITTLGLFEEQYDFAIKGAEQSDDELIAQSNGMDLPIGLYFGENIIEEILVFTTNIHHIYEDKY